MSIFDINFVIFEWLGYKMSLVELVGTVFGLLSVWFAAQSKILTWPVTLVNTIAFFLVFYQVRLYSDMLLQVYFFAVALYGWYYWKRVFSGTEKPISRLSIKGWIVALVIIAIGTAFLGALMSNIHLLMPKYFSEKASFPFINSFTATTSLVANFLLARRKLENWLLWIVVDIVSVVVYAVNGIALISAEFIVLLVICIFGYFGWKRETQANA